MGNPTLRPQRGRIKGRQGAARTPAADSTNGEQRRTGSPVTASNPRRTSGTSTSLTFERNGRQVGHGRLRAAPCGSSTMPCRHMTEESQPTLQCSAFKKTPATPWTPMSAAGGANSDPMTVGPCGQSSVREPLLAFQRQSWRYTASTWAWAPDGTGQIIFFSRSSSNIPTATCSCDCSARPLRWSPIEGLGRGFSRNSLLADSRMPAEVLVKRPQHLLKRRSIADHMPRPGDHLKN